ncbi:hypothetical protein ON010_g1643 [Phytophthora cinnamomi]|nr:hypothetical protein ON010_g1643 [Phytophthora cinnamomi]
MNSALYPPNDRWLSDEMVTTVRCRPSAHDRVHTRELAPGFGPANQRITARLDSNSSPRPHAVRDTVPASRVPLARYPDTTLLATKHKTSLYPDEYAQKRKREHRRLVQIRYRKKLKDRAATLDQQVQTLRLEVQKLEFQHKTISPRLIDNTTPWKVVAEYFRLFRYALMACVPISERCKRPRHANAARIIHPPRFSAANNGAGRDCRERTRGGRNARTLEIHFPLATKLRGPGCAFGEQPGRLSSRLYEDESHPMRIHAALCLSEAHVEILGHTTFVWDSENGRVLSVEGKADVLTPMLRLLGNLDDLAFVFDQALATLQGRLELRPST